jgi:hypothetical protein
MPLSFGVIVRFNEPPTVREWTPGQPDGAAEEFADSVPTTYTAWPIQFHVTVAGVVHTARLGMGVCECPTPPSGGSRRASWH